MQPSRARTADGTPQSARERPTTSAVQAGPGLRRAALLRSPGTALVGLALAAATIRFVASLGLNTPWIAPDELVYGLLGRSFWSTGHAQILDGKTGFFGLYPYLAGAPLAAFGPSAGLVVLKAIQALLMVVPIAVVYVWTRALTRARWALAAAAMTAALPGFVYSGLIMSEVTFLAVVTALLWRLWRALLDPSRRNQVLVAALTALAIAIRLKAVILVPAIFASLLLMAWLSGDRRLVRRIALFATAGLIAAALAVAFAAAAGGGVLGPYAGALNRDYHASAVAHWIAYEAIDVLILVVGAPIVAAAALAVSALRRREDPGVRALVSVILPYPVLLVAEVGAYISKYEPHLNERTLLSVAPPFFVVLAVWLDRGLPKTRTAAISAILLAAAAAFWPVEKLIVSGMVPDTFTPIPLFDLALHSSGSTLRTVWIVLMCTLLLLPLLLPRRLSGMLVVVVVGLLVTASTFAQTKVDGRAAHDRHMFFGNASPQWIDRTANGPVVYLDADPLWAGSWHLAYWNRRITSVVALGEPTGVRPDDVTATIESDGTLVTNTGAPIAQRLALTPATVTLVGRRLAEMPQGEDEPGLTLWRTPAAPRVLSWTHGELPQPVTADIYGGCRGSLELTVAATSGRPSAIVSAGSLQPAILSIPAGRSLRLAVPAQGQQGEHCSFTVATDGDLTVGAVSFRRSQTAPPPGGTTAVRVLGSSRLPGVAPGTPEPPNKLAFCVGGNFQLLPAGAHPGAALAYFVQGTGLTCSIPPGYVQNGYGDDGVPPGVYPLYEPPAS